MLRTQGQSLVEYTFCAFLVMGVSISGLLFLRESLSSQLINMLSKPKLVQVAKAPAAVSPGSDAKSPTPIPAAPGYTVITLKNGQQLSLNLPTDVAQSIQTIGANGTTDLLASNLTAMANQLLESGQITQEQANTLLKLANQAHHIAEIQKLLETYSTKLGSDVTAFKNTPVTIDGTTYANSYEAAQSIGMKSNNTSIKGAELQKFWDLYAVARSANYTWPPELKTILQMHATTINDLSDSMRVAMRNIIQYNAGTPADLNGMMVDQMTHSESVNICHMGGQNQDSGVHCSVKG